MILYTVGTMFFVFVFLLLNTYTRDKSKTGSIGDRELYRSCLGGTG